MKKTYSSIPGLEPDAWSNDFRIARIEDGTHYLS